MDWLAVVMEEYKTLREESLASMKMQQSILSFGTATIGIVISAGFAAWNKTPLPEIIFMFLIPTVIYLVILIWLGEVGRMFRAGSFLDRIEEKVNRQFTDKEEALSWENWLATGEWAGRKPHHGIRLHYVCIFVLFVITALSSVIIGNCKLHGSLSLALIAWLNIAELAALSAVVLLSIKISKTITQGQHKAPAPAYNQANPADAKSRAAD